MIATFVPMLLILFLLACCGVIVMFALLIPRRPVIGGMGIATMVMFIVGAALLLAPGSRYRRAERVLRTHDRVMISGDESSALVLAEQSEVPGVVVEVRDATKSPKHRIQGLMRNARYRHALGVGESVVSTLLMALVIAAFLGVGYVFLDAATRGQFTWTLRIVTLLAFTAAYVVMVSLR